MNFIKSILNICSQNFRKWITDYRIWMIYIIMFILIHSHVSEIASIASAIDEPSSIWIYPFLYSQFYMKLIFTMPIILFFCDAPFIDSNQMFVIVRAGRIKWLIAQLLYILISSAFYYVFIILSTVLLSLPNSSLEMSWGTVLYNIANSSVAGDLNFNFVNVSDYILRYFTPLEATWFTFLLSWISAVFIGIIIFVVNFITNSKYIGSVIASIIIILSCFVANDGFSNLIPYSPITWNTLNFIDVGGTTAYPSFNYCMTVYGVGIFSLIVVLFLSHKKKNIVK